MVNLDHAVWIGVVDVQPDDATVAEPALVAHMSDGSSVTLVRGTEDGVAAVLNDLRHEANAWDVIANRVNVRSDMALQSRIRHED
jgi:hypothetical protein